MNPMRMMRFSSALIVLVLAAGCESDPVSPETNVDAVLSQMASSGISTWSTAAANTPGGGVVVPAPAAGSSSACQYNAGTKFFVCAPVTSNGMTFSRQYQLLDATGAPLSTPNPLAIAAVRSVIDLDGETTTPGANPVTLQIDRHEDATLSGIMSANRVLNGTSTQELTVSGSSWAMTSDEVSTTSNLQLPSSPDQKYPLGGSIVTNGTITGSGITTSTTSMSREILFDGTNFMTVKLTLGTSAMITCKVNMAAPGTPPAC
jgi:hypothetical protein